MEQGSCSGPLVGSPLALALSFPICKLGAPGSLKFQEFGQRSQLQEFFSDPHY